MSQKKNKITLGSIEHHNLKMMIAVEKKDE
jgi:hypothetical protein